MTEMEIRPAAPAWAEVVTGLRLAWGEAVLVLGEAAPEVAEAYRAAGAPEIVSSGPRYALLSSDGVPQEWSGAGPDATGLPGESVDLVVLRHAVPNQAALVGALEEAYRVLRPGGGLLVADVKLEVMMDAMPFRYPARLQYDLFPEALRREAARHVDSADLDIEVIRAGFKEVAGHDVDHDYGEYPSHQAYLEHVRRDGWRSFDLMADDQVEAVLATLRAQLPHIAPLGRVTEREPWHVTRGRKPDQSW